MLYDVDFDWSIAVGILIGLSLFLSFISEQKIDFITILIYMTIIDAFIVSAGFLPLWTQILFILLVTMTTAIKFYGGSNNVD